MGEVKGVAPAFTAFAEMCFVDGFGMLISLSKDGEGGHCGTIQVS